jgi:hypothetical protein
MAKPSEVAQLSAILTVFARTRNCSTANREKDFLDEGIMSQHARALSSIWA